MRTRRLLLAAAAVVPFAMAPAFACVPTFDGPGGDGGGADGTQPGVDGGDASATDSTLGMDADAALPDTSTHADAPFTPLPVETIAAGYKHTCALRDGGAVYCWGNNEGFALGVGDGGPDSSFKPRVVVSPFDGGALGGASGIQAGDEYSCTLVGGTPYCWGTNAHGELANNGYDPQPAPRPVLMPSGQPVTGITRLFGGGIMACGQQAGGDYICWGDNQWGQLTLDAGLGVLREAAVVPALRGAHSMAMGNVHTCAILSDNGVACWGLNDYRQVGQVAADVCTIDSNTAPCVTSPVRVPGIANAQQLALGTGSSCVLDTAGIVRCWGRDGAGELGPIDGGAPPPCAGGVPCTEVPQIIPLPLPAVRITGCEDYNGTAYCAVLTDQSLVCWGSNANGELGDNTHGDGQYPYPQPVRDLNGSLSGVVEVASGPAHKCALIGDGAVLCWGSSDDGTGASDGRLGTPALHEDLAAPVQW